MNYEEKYYQLVYSLTKNYERVTPSKIHRLRTNQVFVFGTDRNGSQRYGAAGFAAKFFGAEVGISEGKTGSSYALPTQGFTIKETVDAIIRFVDYANANTGLIFLITPIGCGHAGFTPEKIAPSFIECLTMNNVWLPVDFISVFRKQAVEKLGLKKQSEKEQNEDDVYMYYDANVHEIIRILIKNNIPFNPEGGFCLKDEEGIVVAEAELGVESEKIVFIPFNHESEKAFFDAGYRVCDVDEYINFKR